MEIDVMRKIESTEIKKSLRIIFANGRQSVSEEFKL